jgi:hypothetical protein
MLAMWARNYLFMEFVINVKSISLKISFKSIKDGSFSLNLLMNYRIEIAPSVELSLQKYEFVSSLSSIDFKS